MTTAQTNPATRLGFEHGQVVREIGHDDDVDHDLRAGIESITGQDLVDDDYDDVADVVLRWFRAGDGDLADELVDAIGSLDEGGDIWLLTPKSGQGGYIEPSDIEEAAKTAGLSQTKIISVSRHWSGNRLATPKAKR
ncbi:DUF3052 domain-containing protein [Actinomadura violacea]|uniref:DUF3052 domain-containing protein n=1 Tax=Actinomadura violacea TaxID=2819934 RepID=A0ABS3RSU0_9ACTN|nr:DUF3052 domain-containing protein [Actinomadura violacea]MBO2459830.1 DUF3052 domain-containing protein [Actinomadura violacea]